MPSRSSALRTFSVRSIPGGRSCNPTFPPPPGPVLLAPPLVRTSRAEEGRPAEGPPRQWGESQRVLRDMKRRGNVNRPSRPATQTVDLLTLKDLVGWKTLSTVQR